MADALRVHVCDFSVVLKNVGAGLKPAPTVVDVSLVPPKVRIPRL